MVERLVVLVENDPVLSERVRAVLSAHGFKVEVIADGNELLTSQQLHPALIILCIDPKRMGWAICNRVKKTVQYREVPLIVTSQEATDKDFEDHKKLRTRAEEYLHKPFSVEVLLSKIDQLIGLRPPGQSDDGAESLDDAAIEEISLDEAAVIEEELQPVGVPPGKPRVDREIDDETDAAFAAIAPGGSINTVELRPKTTAPQVSVPAPSSSRRTPAPGAEPLPPATRRSDIERPAPPRESPQSVSPPTDKIQLPLSHRIPLGERSPALDPNATLKPASSTRTPRREASEPAAHNLHNKGPDTAALEQALAEANKKLEKAEQQASFWHDQRDQLASERDQVAAERNQVLIERNQIVAERDNLAAELDSIKSAAQAGPGPEFLAEKARLSAQRDSLLNERNSITAERDGLLSEREQLAAERRDLLLRLERLGTERDELLAGHDRLAADFAQVQNRLTEQTQLAEQQANQLANQLAAAAGPSPHLAELTETRNERDKLREELARYSDAAAGWQSERTRLLAELDELKSRPAPAPAPAPPPSGLLRDREVISLKEVINKKDKEILDLRDAMDNKDRQVLDARDKSREMERQKRELDERLLFFEREHLGLEEKLEALNADKEVWQEREKGLKGRLEDALRKLTRADEEMQGLRRRLESETARAEEKLVEERRRSEEALANAQREHAAALTKLTAERDARESELVAGHKQSLSQAQSAAEEERRAIEQRHAQSWAQFEAQYQARFDERVRRHEETLVSVQQKYEGQIEELLAQHQQALVAAAAQVNQAHAELSEAKEQHLQALEAQRAQISSELAAQHELMLGRALRETEDRVRAAATIEKDVLRGERSAFERRANELEVQLGELQRHYRSAESKLSTLSQRLEDSDAELTRLREQLSEREQHLAMLRTESSTMQEQIQRAYQRLVFDENQMVRVRRALAIAMGVLDESQPMAAEPTTEIRREA